MNEIELKELIISKFGSVRAFADEVKISNSTINSILERGFNNAKLQNVFAICKTLGIHPDDLDTGFKFVAPSVNTNIEGDNNGVTGVNGEISGDITINNNDANPVPVTVNNLDDVFEVQEKANENHKELNTNQTMVLETMVKLVEVNKEILKELKKLNKKIK